MALEIHEIVEEDDGNCLARVHFDDVDFTCLFLPGSVPIILGGSYNLHINYRANLVVNRARAARACQWEAVKHRPLREGIVITIPAVEVP